jgi:hypothetical protein
LDEPIGLGPVKRDLLNLATRQLPAKISGELLLELAIARAIDNHFCRLQQPHCDFLSHNDCPNAETKRCHGAKECIPDFWSALVEFEFGLDPRASSPALQ